MRLTRRILEERLAKRQPGVNREPFPHKRGALPPDIPLDLVPRHVALVMDGNGRWAKERGLSRIEGHKIGEASLFDVVEGAVQLGGITHISAYAFSTENWKRSPEEVRFLMGFNRDTIRRRIGEMDELGVRIRWAGRRPRLWKSVIDELEWAEERTKDNKLLTLTMCVNYGGRWEIADAMAAMGRDIKAGRLDPAKINEKTRHPLPLRAGHAGRGPVHPLLRRAPHLELPDVGVGLRGVRVRRHALAGLRPHEPVARLRVLRRTRPPLRRRDHERGAVRRRGGAEEYEYNESEYGDPDEVA